MSVMGQIIDMKRHVAALTGSQPDRIALGADVLLQLAMESHASMPGGLSLDEHIAVVEEGAANGTLVVAGLKVEKRV